VQDVCCEEGVGQGLVFGVGGWGRRVWITVVVNGRRGWRRAGWTLWGVGRCVCVCVQFGSLGRVDGWRRGGGEVEARLRKRSGFGVGMEESKIIAEVEARCRADGRAQCR